MASSDSLSQVPSALWTNTTHSNILTRTPLRWGTTGSWDAPWGEKSARGLFRSEEPDSGSAAPVLERLHLPVAWSSHIQRIRPSTVYFRQRCAAWRRPQTSWVAHRPISFPGSLKHKVGAIREQRSKCKHSWEVHEQDMCLVTAIVILVRLTPEEEQKGAGERAQCQVSATQAWGPELIPSTHVTSRAWQCTPPVYSSAGREPVTRSLELTGQSVYPNQWACPGSVGPCL